MKICGICKENKSFDLFSKSKSNKDGLDNRCNKCRREYYLLNKDHIKNNIRKNYIKNRDDILLEKRINTDKKEKYNARRREIRSENPGIDAVKQRRRRKSLRDEVISILGNSCPCGISDPGVLCVDHINDDGKEDRSVFKSSMTLYGKIIRDKERNKYQILCFNCNLTKEIDRQSRFFKTNLKKFCVTCKTDVDTGNFKNDIKYPDGLYYECRPCTRSRVIALKMEAISLVGNPVCNLCGHQDIKSLTFDHTDENGSSVRKIEGLGESLHRNIILGIANVSNLQILCLNCNIKKNVNLKGARKFLTGHQETSIIPMTHVSPKNTAEFEYLGEFDFNELVFEFTSGPDSIQIPFEFLNQFHYAKYGRFGSGHIVVTLRGTVVFVGKFASPVRLGVATSLGLEYSKTLELDRFCIHPGAQKKNMASFILSRASKMIFNQFPYIESLISFADPEQGHSGIIYKASGWEEVKSNSRSYEYIDNCGQILHKKTVWNQARSRNLSEKDYSEQVGLIRRYTVRKKKFILRRHSKIR